MDSVIGLGEEVRKRDLSVMCPGLELGRLGVLGVPPPVQGIQEGTRFGSQVGKGGRGGMVVPLWQVEFERRANPKLGLQRPNKKTPTSSWVGRCCKDA